MPSRLDCANCARQRGHYPVCYHFDCLDHHTDLLLLLPTTIFWSVRRTNRHRKCAIVCPWIHLLSLNSVCSIFCKLSFLCLGALSHCLNAIMKCRKSPCHIRVRASARVPFQWTEMWTQIRYAPQLLTQFLLQTNNTVLVNLVYSMNTYVNTCSYDYGP